MLGCQAIVNGDPRGVRSLTQTAALAVEEVQIAQNEAAPVKEDDHRKAGARVSTIHRGDSCASGSRLAPYRPTHP